MVWKRGMGGMGTFFVESQMYEDGVEMEKFYRAAGDDGVEMGRIFTTVSLFNCNLRNSQWSTKGCNFYFYETLANMELFQ